MIRIKPRKVLTFGAATATLLVLGGCWNCPTCPPEKDIEYAWDIPESQADCAAGTIFTDDTPQSGDLAGTGIVDRAHSGCGPQTRQWKWHPAPRSRAAVRKTSSMRLSGR